MSKTQKELAFLRDLTVKSVWTDRFKTTVDKHFTRPKKGSFLYVNAGTLDHALEIREKLKHEVSMTCVCDTLELRRISEAKAKAVRADIVFADLKNLKSETFDAVLADLTFVDPADIDGVIDNLSFVAKKGAEVSFFVATAGSFGEIFSYLWETFIGVELIERSGEIETLIGEIPTVSRLEQIATESGIGDVLTETALEIFEYESGKEFVDSSLLEDFLFPRWLDFLSPKERRQVLKKLQQIIDQEHEKLTFRFTVKASYVKGVKGTAA